MQNMPCFWKVILWPWRSQIEILSCCWSRIEDSKVKTHWSRFEAYSSDILILKIMKKEKYQELRILVQENQKMDCSSNLLINVGFSSWEMIKTSMTTQKWLEIKWYAFEHCFSIFELSTWVFELFFWEKFDSFDLCKDFSWILVLYSCVEIWNVLELVFEFIWIFSSNDPFSKFIFKFSGTFWKLVHRTVRRWIPDCP